MDERYLTSFEDQTSALGYTSGDATLVSPQVSLVGVDEVVYSKEIPSESKIRFAKDEATGRLYFVVDVEETDPTEGYVDLGLSVMWASCDVGATSPEGEGAKYAWGEESWNTIPLESDPVYMNSDMELNWKESLRPRTPSPAQVKELLDNTTATEEVLNGVSGVRYTANNGNSIFVSDVFRWTNAEKYLVNAWCTYEAACWRPSSGIIDNTHTYNTISGIKSDYTMKEYNYPFRGVCSNLPQGGAQVLTVGQEIQVQENTLYCFPKTWTATKILAATSQSVSVYISNIADFEIGDENVLMSCPAFLEGSQRAVYLSGKELANLAEQATGDYLYVRFSCTPSTKISINAWEASECADKSYMIPVNEAVRIEPNTSYKIYRLRYADVQGAELKLKWSGNGTIKPYISYTCDYMFSEAQYLLLNPAPNIRRRGTYTISADDVNAWASRVNAEGFIFVNFNASSVGEITFAVEKPADVDPVSTTSLTSTDCGCIN